MYSSHSGVLTAVLASFKNKSDKKRKVLEPRGRELSRIKEYNSSELLELCIHSMESYIWYRIISKNTFECDHVSFSMGQSWDLIRPLLVSLGYIDVRGGVLNVRAKKLLLLSDIYNGSEKVHISDTHLKGGNKQYFMCLGKPMFDAPRRQIDAIKKGKFEFGHLRSLKTIDYKLRIKLQEYSDKNERVIDNEMTSLIDVTPDLNGITTIDNVQKEHNNFGNNPANSPIN